MNATAPIGGSRASPTLPLAALALVNLIVFGRHYFTDVAFPWDFLKGYHAVPFYWNAMLKAGQDIGWVAVQGGGYPLFLNVQSGILYPPLHLFWLTGGVYTPKAAVVLQGAHVLLGAVGTWLMARRLGAGSLPALFGAIVFHGFGGFYAQSEHPDIIRAYALVPWLLLPLVGSDPWTARRMLEAVLLIPILVYLLLAGGYPGTALAGLFLAGLTAALRLVVERPPMRCATVWAAAFAVGLALGAAALLPMYLMRGEIARVQELDVLERHFLVPETLAFLLQPTNVANLALDVSMRSAFVGLAALALALSAGSREVAAAKWLALPTAVAMLMGSGVIHGAVSAVIAPLSYSRFPAADYRIYLGLLIAVLAALSLQSINENGMGKRRPGALAFAILVVYSLWVLGYSPGVGLGHLLWTLAAGLLVVWLVFGPGRQIGAARLFALLLALYAADWGRVVWNKPYWTDKKAEAAFLATTGIDRSSEERLLRAMHATFPCRGPRIDVSAPTDISWRGYYTGEYLLFGYDASANFARNRRIAASAALHQFAARAWEAKVFDIDANPSEAELGLPGAVGPDSGTSECIAYGPTEVVQRVRLTVPSLLVTNDLYARGWTARLRVPDGSEHRILEPVEIHGFRGWRLPPGEYEVAERFSTPHVNEAILLALIAVGGWLGLLLGVRKSPGLLSPCKGPDVATG